MNPSVLIRTAFRGHRFIPVKFLCPFFCLYLLLPSGSRAQEKCSACSVPAFPALTVYHAFQTGPAMGVGIEAGKWKKDAGRFSYFFGTEMLWSEKQESGRKTLNDPNELIFSFYWKGQYKLANRLYLIGQPTVVNLSFFEMRTGLRYVIPLTKIVGIGVEPGYSLIKKEWSLNTNIHFALL